MNGKDLMCGDWVLSKENDKPCKIVSVNKQTDKSVLLATENGLHFDYMYKPVPIQRIHLTKNGFKAQDEDDCVFVYSDGYVITVHFDDEIIDKGNNIQIPATVFIRIDFAEKEMCMEIKYLHELQHAMKLFGIDKEIKL